MCSTTLLASPTSTPRELTLANFLLAYPDLVLVGLFRDDDFENRWCSDSPRYLHQTYDGEAIFHALHKDSATQQYVPATLEQVKTALLEEEDAQRIFTPQEFDEFSCESRRQKLEEDAQHIARKYNATLGTFGFLEALDLEEASWQSARESLREDGLCAGYGLTRDQWFEEDTFFQDQRANVTRIREFLDQYCPLLMAMWREKQAREATAPPSA